jgi:hypothetical protein
MSQSFYASDELRRIIEEGRVSEETVAAITGISAERLASFLTESGSDMSGLSKAPSALSNDESARISGLASQLTAGMDIDDDERLQGILESLIVLYHFTPENIALLIQAQPRDVESILRDSSSIPADTKYRLALRASYLVNATEQARRR